MAEHSPSSSPVTFADAAPAPPGSQVTITERADLGLATLQARKGQEAALREAIRQYCGVMLPDRPAVASADTIAFAGLGPQHWLGMADGSSHRLATALKAAIGPLASIASAARSTRSGETGSTTAGRPGRITDATSRSSAP